MKFANKFIINAGLFSVLSLLLLIPVLTITMANFSSKTLESSEVLSAQDKNVNDQKELYNDVPVELEEIIRKVELEMAKKAADSQEAAESYEAAESSVNNDLEIGN